MKYFIIYKDEKMILFGVDSNQDELLEDSKDIED
jgi:hypothetical protein